MFLELKSTESSQHLARAHPSGPERSATPVATYGSGGGGGETLTVQMQSQGWILLFAWMLHLKGPASLEGRPGRRMLGGEEAGAKGKL